MITELELQKSPVTKDLLKAFGERCKAIFRPTPALNSSVENTCFNINTDINFTYYWNIQITVVGLDEYGNGMNNIILASNTSNGIKTAEFVLGETEISGVAFYANELGKLVISCTTYNLPQVVLVDLIKIKESIGSLSDDTCNRASSVEFTFINENITQPGLILGTYNGINGITGNIMRASSTPTEFTIQIWDDINNVQREKTIGPSADITHITEKLYNTHIADYVRLIQTITLNGDVTGTITTGGENSSSTASITLSSIINPENVWYRKFKVNSKGLVIDMSTDIDIPTATSLVLGGLKTGFTDTTRYKGVKLDESTDLAYIDLGESLDTHRGNLNVENANAHIGLIWLHIGPTDATLTQGYFYKSLPYPGGYSVQVPNSNYTMENNLHEYFVNIQKQSWQGQYDNIILSDYPDITIVFEGVSDSVNLFKLYYTIDPTLYTVVSETYLNSMGIYWKQDAPDPTSSNSVTRIIFDFTNNEATWTQINVQPAFEYNGEQIDWILTSDIDTIILEEW